MKRVFKIIAKLFAATLAIIFVYWLIISFPQLFFRSAQFENLYLYHHGNADVNAVGQKALSKIKKSELYDANDVYRVFLTDSAAEYAFFTSLWRNSGGVYIVFARGNIFIRPSLIAEDRLISPSGQIVAEDRPLNYFVAHEVAHAMEYNRIGLSKYFYLNEWVREGIADQIGRDSFDFEQMLANYRNDLPMMNYRRSGLYLKYQLLVEFTMRQQNIDAASLLEKNPSETETEAEMREFYKIGN